MLNASSYEIRLINIIEMCYCFIHYILSPSHSLLPLTKFITKQNHLLVYSLNVSKFVKCSFDYIYWFSYTFCFIHDHYRRKLPCIDFTLTSLLVLTVSKIGTYCGCRKDLAPAGSYFPFCSRRIKMEAKVWTSWSLQGYNPLT